MSQPAPINLEGRSALVTGSTRGIGRALVLALAGAGANVAVHGTRPSAAAENTAAACRDLGARAEILVGDLGEPGAPSRLVDECTGLFGSLDILVLNASIQFRRTWDDFNPEETAATFAVNVAASAEMMARAVPPMRTRGWGRVVTIGSVQQNVPSPAMPVYAASKCAQLSLVQSLAPRVAADGVTVNNLAPGIILTDRNKDVLADETYRKVIQGLIPARRFGEPEDCAGALLLLCSEAGAYITGANLAIDGGMGLGAR